MVQPDPQSLARLRQAIDAVDDQVLALLNRRAGLAERQAWAQAMAGLDLPPP